MAVVPAKSPADRQAEGWILNGVCWHLFFRRAGEPARSRSRSFYYERRLARRQRRRLLKSACRGAVCTVVKRTTWTRRKPAAAALVG